MYSCGLAKGLGERVLTGVRDRFPLVPAQAGTQNWIPAVAGMSGFGRALTLTLAIAALGLCGCGRAGPLELPPGPATPAPSAQLTQPDGTPAPGTPGDNAMKNGFDAMGNPVATPGQKKPFILDPLVQ
jgi:predicted small lipoprotein YifL